MKKAKAQMQKYLSVLLAVVMLVCAVPMIASAHSYSSDYRKWSQGGSDYQEVREVGCWIVAISKLLYETNVERSETFNPDRFYEWECQNHLLQNPPDNLDQTKGGEAPVIYAQQKGIDLTYFRDEWSNSDDQIMWNTVEAGYFTIVTVSENNFQTSHYVMIDNERTKATNQLYCYDSFNDRGEVDSQPLSRYPYRGRIYVYQANLQVGDIVNFGSYPQSRVMDSNIVSALNSRASDWKSYGYYSGTDYPDGKMTAKDFMKYCDVDYNGNKYRGVRFSQYRPYCTTSSEENSHQKYNGYTTHLTYWFKYEPLQWKVLDPLEGLILCLRIIDNQPINNYAIESGIDSRDYTACWSNAEKTYYVNDYANSSLRKWLNESYYITAFSEEQRNQIKTNQNQNNDGLYTIIGDKGHEDFDSAPTNDKIFLLSYDEVRNTSYGFLSTDIDLSREATGSDYAQCQGLGVHSDGKSSWWLRTPGGKSRDTLIVFGSGGIVYWEEAEPAYFCVGIRPACKVSDLSLSDIAPQSETHTHTAAASVKENEHAATQEKPGSYEEVIYCTECGAELSRRTVVINPLPPEESKVEEAISAIVAPATNKSVIQRIVDWFRNLFDKLFGWIK